MEPPALPDRDLKPPRPPPRSWAGRARFDLRVGGDARLRSAFAGGALAAAAAGLLGVPAGVLWTVAGVWTARAVWGGRPGLAWGIACVGAALRWHTLSVADVAVAARLAGPGLLAGPLVMRVGMALALAGAVVDEAAGGGLRGRSAAEKAAAGLALLALVPLFALGSPALSPLLLALAWAGAAAAACLLALLLEATAGRLPWWGPAAAAAGGCGLALLAR